MNVKKFWNPGYFASGKPICLGTGYPLYGRMRYRRRLRVGGLDLLEHMVIAGASGSGKTEVGLCLIKHHIDTNRGFTVIDPHGDFGDKVIALIADRALPDDPTDEDLQLLGDKLVILEPSTPDQGFPGLNLLEVLPGQLPYVVVDSILQVIKQLWMDIGSAARMEDILRQSLNLLVELELTLGELPALLTSAKTRAVLVGRSRNAEIKSFFNEHLGELRDSDLRNFLESSRNKVAALMAHPLVAPMLSQSTSTIRLDQILQRGQWFICKLPHDQYKQTSGLIGGLVAAKVHDAALLRNNDPPASRIFHQLIIDELARFYSPVILEALTGARKMGLGLCLMLQNLTQPPFGQSPEIIDTILGNTKTRVAFAVGNREDADRLTEQLFLPTGELPQFQSRVLGVTVKRADKFWSLQEEKEACALQLMHQRTAEMVVSFRSGRDPRPYIGRALYQPPLVVDERKIALLRRHVRNLYYRSMDEIEADRQARWDRLKMRDTEHGLRDFRR